MAVDIKIEFSEAFGHVITNNKRVNTVAQKFFHRYKEGIAPATKKAFIAARKTARARASVETRRTIGNKLRADTIKLRFNLISTANIKGYDIEKFHMTFYSKRGRKKGYKGFALSRFIVGDPKKYIGQRGVKVAKRKKVKVKFGIKNNVATLQRSFIINTKTRKAGSDSNYQVFNRRRTPGKKNGKFRQRHTYGMLRMSHDVVPLIRPRVEKRFHSAFASAFNAFLSGYIKTKR